VPICSRRARLLPLYPVPGDTEKSDEPDADVQPPLYVNPALHSVAISATSAAGINHRPRSNHCMLFRSQDSAGYELQDVAFFPNDDRMPRVVPPATRAM